MTRRDDEPSWEAQSTRPLPLEAVDWGFRLLAGRDPVTTAEFNSFRALPDIDAMRRAFTNLHEFHDFFSAVLTGTPSWEMPLFLLRPPANPTIPWTFAPPNLDRPTSQLCTAAQCAEPVFLEIMAAMGLRPGLSRSLWEQAWIVSVLATEGLIAPGRMGLGLEPGRHRIGSLLASRGVAVQGVGRGAAGPHGTEVRRLDLFHPEVVRIEDFDAMVGFAEMDPLQPDRLPPDAFDFCWSSGHAHRLGSVSAALDFFEASLVPVRPGGLAVHSCAFNLTSDRLTWELPDLVVLRRSDIEALAERLQRAGGHELLTFNTHPGHDAADETVKPAVPGPPGIRQRQGFAVVTSLGIAIRKAG
jgi:hypothetical protein